MNLDKIIICYHKMYHLYVLISSFGNRQTDSDSIDSLFISMYIVFPSFYIVANKLTIEDIQCLKEFNIVGMFV